MKLLRSRRGWMIGAFIGYAVLAIGFGMAHGAGAAQPAAPADQGGIAAFSAPTYSSPIAMSVDNTRIWVVNPDDDSVSVIDPATDTAINKFIVGDEPQSVALDLNGIAYVANAASNNVTIVSPVSGVIKTLTTGAEPWNVVISPDGARAFVANSAQDTITVIRTDTRTIVGSVDIRNSVCNVLDRGRHFQPRGMAVTLNSDRLYVTRFLSFTKTNGAQGTDDGKEGVVCRIDLPAAVGTLPPLTALTPIRLSAQNTGFADANGAATKAYPNQMQSIVIRGNNAFLPNIASSPSGPLKFNVDTQAFVNTIGGVNGATQTDGGALNLHLGARNPETGKTKLFFANPWAIAFSSPSGAGTAYAVSAGSDLLVKLNISAANVLTFTSGLANQTRYIDLHDPANPATSGANAGKNPLGLVIRNIAPGNNKAYVMNYVSRNVSVVNLDTDTVAKVIPTTGAPTAGSQDEQVQVGKEIFFASRGVFNGGKTNRLSSEGWQNCASCHFAGLTDGTVWTFNAGPRKAVPLNGTFNPHDPDEQRVLNYSAIFDEVQDFEANIRNVSGPGNLPAPAPVGTLDPNHGLLIGDDGNINNAPAVVNTFLKPNAGRPQLTVTLPSSNTAWPALDALNEWVRFSVRTPNGPLTTDQISLANGGINASDVRAGRVLFFKAGCQTCHGGGKWTNSSKDFVSPPPGTELATEVFGALPPPNGSPAPPAGVNPVGAQFLFNKLQDINSFNLGRSGINPFGSNIGAAEVATDGKDALGKDHNLDLRGNGFNVPSLLGIWSLPPYYHNGACESLACVVNDIQHRTAKGTRPDTLTNLNDRAKLVTFLQSLDANTNPISNLYVKRHDLFLEPSAPIAGDQLTVGANISVFGPDIDFNALIGKPIKVKFTLTKRGSSTPVTNQEIEVPNFANDFGQEAIKAAAFTLPNQPGVYTLEVFVDSGGDFREDRETDNTARRTFVVRPIPPDRTAPVITDGSTVINDDAVVVTSRDVTVKFKASDPAGPAGQSVSGLGSFCVVRYYYNGVQRRWVEEECNFKPLPTPDASGTFAVPAKLTDRIGVNYVFVWVKDKAGNISKTPGFDFTNFIPAGEQRIDRNDVRVFRLRLAVGQTFKLKFTPTVGDVDATVFQGITNPLRCDTSAIQNGTTPETVTVPSASCTGLEFQIEVRAVVNSRFTITPNPVLADLFQLQQAASVPAAAVLADAAPTVAGPPSLQTAIDGAAPVMIPIVVR